MKEKCPHVVADTSQSKVTLGECMVAHVQKIAGFRVTKVFLRG